jgi:4-amino-4-deoxy-L-arabinose transferase-like glycosyltransferase
VTTARWCAALLTITAMGGAFRVAVAYSTHPVALVGDEHYYLEVARSIAAGAGHHASRLEAWAAWPPGQAFWLSHFVEGSTSAPAIAQALLGTAIVALVGWLGSLLVDRRSGLVAALLAALLPELVAFSHYLWATTLFTTLALAGWCGVAWAARGAGFAWAAAAGLAFGLATLTRESGAALALGGAAFLVWRAPPARRGGAAARGALMLALCALVVFPWTLRNLERTGQWIPVSTVGWMALREGNTLHPADWMQEDHEALGAFRRSYYALPESRRAEVARSEATQLILEQQPAWIGVKLVRNLAWLTTPDSFLLYKLSYRAYGELPLAATRFILLATVGLYGLVFLLGTLGLAIGRSGGAASFAVTAATPLLVLHVLANASPRYRVPLLPLLLIGSGAALCQWRELRARIRRPEGIPALAILLFFLTVSVPSFIPDATKLWTRGTVFTSP